MPCVLGDWMFGDRISGLHGSTPTVSGGHHENKSV